MKHGHTHRDGEALALSLKAKSKYPAFSSMQNPYADIFGLAMVADVRKSSVKTNGHVEYTS